MKKQIREAQNEKENKHMKTITNIIYPAFVLFAALILPRVAHAQRVEVFKVKDLLADAQFTSLDFTGCIQTDVVVFAGSAKIKDTGSPLDVEPMVNVTYAVNDICNPFPVLLRSGFGSTNVINFQMDSGLVATHASATVPVSDDQNGTTIYLYVKVDWSGFGDITTLRVKDHFDTPSSSVNFRAKGSFREATVSGSVSDGTVNFTPAGSAVSATLQVVSQASVTIQRD
jgi:hypothetical protein